MITLFSGGLWSLIRQSDFTSALILIFLLFISLMCWTLFLYTVLRMREQRRNLRYMIKKITMNGSLELALQGQVYSDLLASRYCIYVVECVRHIGSVQMLDDRRWELLQQQLVQYAEQLIAQQEFVATILSTSASVAPLLGLLGTVWGLVHAFMNIAATQSADIAAVAPGIAEALITTIAGLLVAIPALAMYNLVVHMHSGLREHMYELADTVIMVLHKNKE